MIEFDTLQSTCVLLNSDNCYSNFLAFHYVHHTSLASLFDGGSQTFTR